MDRCEGSSGGMNWGGDVGGACGPPTTRFSAGEPEAGDYPLVLQQKEFAVL